MDLAAPYERQLIKVRFLQRFCRVSLAVHRLLLSERFSHFVVTQLSFMPKG